MVDLIIKTNNINIILLAGVSTEMVLVMCENVAMAKKIAGL